VPPEGAGRLAPERPRARRYGRASIKTWENVMFEWMAWTLPVAVFFTCIALMLVAMTVWELKRPTTMRRGWLPIATTRGDRLFMGLMAAAWVNLGFVGISEKAMTWFSLEQEPSIWISFIASMLVLALIMRKG
jgi:predicted small integral membrane protein